MPLQFRKPAWKRQAYSNIGEAKTGWEAVGGNCEFYPFYQLGTLTDLNAQRRDATVVEVQKGNSSVEIDVLGGICNALVLRFIENRLHDYPASLNAANLDTQFRAEMVRQASIQAKVADGFTLTRGLTRGQTFLKEKGSATHMFRAVGSRDQLVERICKEDHLWMYKVTASNGKAQHAIGIDSRNGEVHFFDPECGYFYTDQKPQLGSNEATAFKKVLYQMWNRSGHKMKYAEGGRFLYEYA